MVPSPRRPLDDPDTPEDAVTTPAEAVDRPDEHAGDPAGRHRPASAVGLVRLGRPRQWIKNLLVFVAPAAAGVLFHRHVPLAHASAAFGIFCVAASGTYFLNDAFDADGRPAPPVEAPPPGGRRGGAGAAGRGASGSASWRSSSVLAELLAGWHLALVMAVYALVNVAYSLGPQERAHPRPGRGQRRVRPAGRGRRRGHRGRPVQLVPHRGLVRVAAGRDRQAVGREAAAGRPARPTTADPPDARLLHPDASSARSGPCRPR